MSTFLTGKELEDKLTDIIWNAKKHIIIISPFIKLDDHIKSIFEKVKSTHEVSLYVVFGKNEEYKYKSFNEDDFNYIKEFKNVTILYNKNLHAKHYCNESEGLITSLNLYGYSMINNIEYGVYFSKTLNPMDKLFEETDYFTDELVFEKSEVVYLKKPQYSKKLFGLSKQYEQSKVLFDISDEFFGGRNNYEVKYLKDFDLELETSLEKKYSAKPQRQEVSEVMDNNTSTKEPYKNRKVNVFIPANKTGYCIRTGVEIPFNPEQPMIKSAWQTWNRFGDANYPETYCHKTGQQSYGKTCMANPILSSKKVAW